MPTGYTADVADGKVTELEPFVWHLARGMGALITMRDEPWDAPVPELLQPSTWNAERLAEAKVERDRLYAMTNEDAQVEADAEYAEGVADKEKAEIEHRERRQRYQSMIEKVEAWTGAPEGIKEFGLEQLRSGMDFDCREPFKYWREVEKLTGAEWRRLKLEKTAKDIEYHSAEDAKERARTDGRNAWLAQLRKSLPRAASPAGGASSAALPAPSSNDHASRAEAADVVKGLGQ